MTAVDPEGRIRHPLDVFHSTLEPDGDFVPSGYIPMADGLGQVEYVDSATLGGAPASADYLVGTANGSLSSEIVVGTTPGGELGGTWASPTVDTTHAGTNHLQPVRKNSTGTVFERRRLNLIEGSNVTLTVADDSGNDEVDITIAATGGGGGSLDLAGDTGSSTATDDITFIGAGGIAVDVNDLGGGAAEVTIDGSGVSGGGGGVGWSLDVNQTGTSFASFTAGSGTWSSNGTEIIQTDTGSAQRRVKYNTLVPIGFPTILEVEAQVASVGGGGLYRAGLLISDGSNSSGLTVYLDQGASNVSVEADAATLMRSISRSFSTATWYKLRVVIGSWYLSIYVDGTLIGNAPVTRGEVLDDNGEFVGLYTYAASVKFRNFKVWTLSTGAPA